MRNEGGNYPRRPSDLHRTREEHAGDNDTVLLHLGVNSRGTFGSWQPRSTVYMHIYTYICIYTYRERELVPGLLYRDPVKPTQSVLHCPAVFHEIPSCSVISYLQPVTVRLMAFMWFFLGHALFWWCYVSPETNVQVTEDQYASILLCPIVKSYSNNTHLNIYLPLHIMRKNSIFHLHSYVPY